jgi:hypothetical protein
MPNYNSQIGLRSRQQRETGKAIGKAMGFFMLIFMAVIITVIFGSIALLMLSILFIGFVIKVIYRLIIKYGKKRDVEIFKKTNFEEKILLGLNNMMKSMSKGYSRIFGSEGKREFGLEKAPGRYCEMCGKHLKTRRRFCSDCRPSGRYIPFWAPKDQRLATYSRRARGRNDW